MKTYVFDILDTADGYEIYWLHDELDHNINPDDLYCYKDEFEERCKEIVLEDSYHYIDYVFGDDIEEWISEFWKTVNTEKFSH
tara:strand:+ start:395 stop:643 length:249 start_codon:yes stop_codon:yes gene_type:complete